MLKGLRKWQFDVWSNDVTLANHLESGGVAGRVHVSQTTADCLAGSYELEPAEGHLRDGYIRQAGIRTYFIQTSGSQSSSRPAGLQKQAGQRELKPRPSLVHGLQTTRLSKARGGRSSAEDDDEDMDEEYDEERWEPEIPFMNLNVPEPKTAVPDLLVQAETAALPACNEDEDSRANSTCHNEPTGEHLQLTPASKSVGSLLRSSFRRRGRSTSGRSNVTPASHQRSFKVKAVDQGVGERFVHAVSAEDTLCNDKNIDQQPIAGGSQVEDQRGPNICIKIVDTTADSTPLASPLHEITAEAGADPDCQVTSSSSVIVSCPLGGDTTTSLKQLANATTTDERTTHSYVLLFSRLLCNKIRRTGCCGFGGSRQTNNAIAHRRELTRCSSSSFESTALPKQADQAEKVKREPSPDVSSIEVEISRRMMKEHINWFKLTFKSRALEDAYCQIRYTTSKSNIVYIFVTWLLMSLVAFCSLPDFWNTSKIFLLATIPLSAFAFFYMSDSILYNRYMNHKLREAAAMSQASRPSTVSNGERQLANQVSSQNVTTATSGRSSSVQEAQSDKRTSGVSSSSLTDLTSSHWHVGPLVHRVARFWSKLDRIPMIWNVFILIFNLIMTAAFLRMNYFTCKPTYTNCTSTDSKGCRWQEDSASSQQEYVCFNHESLIFNVILILIEVGAFYRSSYLRKVILLLLVTLSFAAFFTWLNFEASAVTSASARSNPSEPNLTLAGWSLFNVALDRSVCPLTRPFRAPLAAENSTVTLTERLIGLNVISPQTLMMVSQCDPKLVEKSYIIIAFIFLGLVYVCRSTERISRLDFLWKLQASKELQDIRALRHYNTQLLENILPDHVAAHFLKDERDSEELYAKSYNCVAVLFASIPNFSSFYSEDINNGMECIRLLNEIIFDFDQLLEDEQFKSLEKVKTISSTYLAACGLNPRDQLLPPSYHLSVCCKFAFAMKRALNEVNVHSFNNFVMRIGVSHGPLVGGVIGAKKPVFDIWGDTVNEASRMDSTGSLDMIQVPKGSADILSQAGFKVKCRGVIPVKGKGNMETYYVIDEPSGCKQLCPTGAGSSAACPMGNPQPTSSTQETVGQRLVSIQDLSESAELEPSAHLVDRASSQSEKAEHKVKLEESARKVATDRLSSSDKGDQLVNKLSAPPGAPSQPKRFTRHSRNTQSLRYPSNSAKGALASAKRSQLRARELAPVGVLGDLELDRLVADESPAEISSSRGRLALQERLRSVSPLNLIESQGVFDKLLDYRGPNSDDQSGQSAQANHGPGTGGTANEDGSLAAVVYNMVQMRKSYDPKLTRLTASSSTGPHGSYSGIDSSSSAANVRDLSKEESSSRLTGLSLGSGSVRLFKGQQSSLIARPKSAQNADSMRKSMRNRASFFRRRPNYRRAGTSEAGREHNTEESIHEQD